LRASSYDKIMSYFNYFHFRSREKQCLLSFLSAFSYTLGTIFNSIHVPNYEWSVFKKSTDFIAIGRKPRIWEVTSLLGV
jgi:hypothetical protein